MSNGLYGIEGNHWGSTRIIHDCQNIPKFLGPDVVLQIFLTVPDLQQHEFIVILRIAVEFAKLTTGLGLGRAGYRMYRLQDIKSFFRLNLEL